MTNRIALGKDFNPGGAKWCDEHGHLECTKNKSRGRGPCHARPIAGTDACVMHGGKKKELAIAQGEARIHAWNPTGKAEKPISAPMAVLGVLQMSWLRLAAYTELLRKQVEESPELAGDPRMDDVPKASGLIGYRYGAAGKEGVIYVQNEQTRALVDLEAAERDRIVKYAKTAHDMGISARLTDLAERWGDVVATSISAMLGELDLNPEQAARVPVLIQSHLGSIDLASLGADGDKDLKG